MNRPNKVPTQSEADARKRREIRESKPVSEWTVEEHRETFREARWIEQETAEAGIPEEWELCEGCHENVCEQGFRLCKSCIDEIRQYES